MSSVFPSPPRGPEEEKDATRLQIGGERAEVLRRWTTRALQWRAVALAEIVFGGPVETRLRGGAAMGFHGLLELEVPFDDLERHREREARFLASARHDDVLGGMPVVVTFTPRVAAP